MVWIREIIQRTKHGDLLDSLVDDKVAKNVYRLYQDMIKITSKFRVLNYELDHDTSANLQQQVRITKDYVLSEFPPTSIARQMTEEMYRYFDWYGD